MSKQYFFIILILLLTSCATPSPIALSDTKALPQGEVLVFGRLKVLVFREGVLELYVDDWDSIGEGFLMYILPDADSAPVPYILTGDGSFYWHLPPGDYIITEFTWRRLGWKLHTVRRAIFARFVIPEATSPIYIGTLTIRSAAGRYTMSIEDEYDEALQRLKQRLPKVKGPIAKRLMQLELP